MFVDERRQNVGSVNMIKRGDPEIRSVANDCLTKIYDTVALNVIQKHCYCCTRPTLERR